MRASFTECTEAFLTERQLDAEMTAAGEKSFKEFSDLLLEVGEFIGEKLIRTLEHRPGVLVNYQEMARENLYLFAGKAHLVGRSDEFKSTLFMRSQFESHLERFIERMITNEPKLNATFDIRKSKIIGTKSDQFTIGDPLFEKDGPVSKRLIVLPKSITPSMLKAMYAKNADAKFLIILHTSPYVESGTDTGHFGGTFRQSVVTYPDKKMFLGDAQITVSGFSAFLVSTLTDVALSLMNDYNKPTIMKQIIGDWLNVIRKNLRACQATYVHEYVHFLDSVRMAGVVPKNVKQGIDSSWKKNRADEDWGKYYLSDIEWNAHFQDVVFGCRSALKDYLIAVQSNVLAVAAAGESGVYLNSRTDTITINPEKASTVGGAMADFVKSMLVHRLREEGANRHKVLPIKIDPVVDRELDAFRSILLKYLTPNPKHLFFVYVLACFLNDKRSFVSHLHKDENFRQKFYVRLYTVADEMNEVLNKAMDDMRAGKFPSKQAWNKAIAGFQRIGTADRVKFRGDAWNSMGYQTNAHTILYTGLFMSTINKINGPAEPSKPIKHGKEVYEFARMTIANKEAGA